MLLVFRYMEGGKTNLVQFGVSVIFLGNNMLENVLTDARADRMVSGGL